MPQRITVDQLFNVLRFGTPHFFSVTFERRTSRADGSAVAGDNRTMLCRTGVERYKQGVVPNALRDAEDFRCGVLTVWAMDVYMRLRRRGMDQEHAGWEAWRRVDLVTLSECSIIASDELPPDIIANLHNITNAYRAANMPRQPIVL